MLDAPVKIGRFRILELIGYGSMAHVYRARDLTLNRDVALKLLPQRMQIGERTISLEQLIVEARSAAQLDHPNIIRIYEVGRHKGLFYIAMELLEGSSLSELLDSAGKIDSVRACQLTADVAEALTYAHKHGVIHRDIKPGNLMLTRAGRCRLIDFGLAKVIDFGDQFGSGTEIVGTPYYIAPEVIRGSPATAQSDIYNLGATLWHLVTGEPPFIGRNPREVMMMHLTEPLPDLHTLAPDAPDKLKHALTIALSKNPGDRFESTKQFAQILRGLTIPGNDNLSTMQQLTRDHDNAPVVLVQGFAPKPDPINKPFPMILVGGGLALVLLVLGVFIGIAIFGGEKPEPGPLQATVLLEPSPAPTPSTPPPHTHELIGTQGSTTRQDPPATAPPAPPAPAPVPSTPPRDQLPVEAVQQSDPTPAEVITPPALAVPVNEGIQEEQPAPEPAPQADPFMAYEAKGALRAWDGEAFTKLIEADSRRRQAIVGHVTRASVTSTGKTFRIELDNERGFYAVAFPGTFRDLGKAFGGPSGEGLHGKPVRITGPVTEYRGTPQIIIEKPEQIRILNDIDQAP